ncbi:uncharacterized protein LOC120145931 [Hibiscus syriacus]|uniref:uncharacterized protein LOC120145931 n=1 Tax=Hibiscus syriacus TaxID=106335 RepID=UPI0019222FD5|nr:uncharacterized protein LOC120145931 [Hibiscus syriacus]
MAPYEDKIVGPDLIIETEEKIWFVQNQLKEASDRKRSYVNLKSKNVEFAVGDKVFFKVSHWKKLLRFEHKEKRYRSDPSHAIPLEQIDVSPDMTYSEKPVRILTRDVRELRSKKISLVKVLWRNYGVEEANWETKEDMQLQYPHLFFPCKFRG